MEIDAIEFLNFLNEMTKELRELGLSENEITTAIAKAIKTREEERNKTSKKEPTNKKQQPQEKVIKRQVSYEPQQTEVIKEMPQLVYGPPQISETVVIEERLPQLLYGPPSSSRGR